MNRYTVCNQETSPAYKVRILDKPGIACELPYAYCSLRSNSRS